MYTAGRQLLVNYCGLVRLLCCHLRPRKNYLLFFVYLIFKYLHRFSPALIIDKRQPIVNTVEWSQWSRTLLCSEATMSTLRTYVIMAKWALAKGAKWPLHVTLSYHHVCISILLMFICWYLSAPRSIFFCYIQKFVFVGLPNLGHAAPRDPRDDQQVHVRPHQVKNSVLLFVNSRSCFLARYFSLFWSFDNFLHQFFQ